MRHDGVMPSVSCPLRYQVDPSKTDAFERFAKSPVALVERIHGRPVRFAGN